MGQPVRRVIKEMHPELSAKPIYTLIDEANYYHLQLMYILVLHLTLGAFL